MVLSASGTMSRVPFEAVLAPSNGSAAAGLRSPGFRGELTRSGGCRLTAASPKVSSIERCSDANLIEPSTEAINLLREIRRSNMTELAKS
jgi:hypothetical protein